MFIPKRYGESKRMDCPFCKKPAITQNMQGVPTCNAHNKEKLPDMKCMCGSWLELKQGDWGVYFNCINCGNLSFAKALARTVTNTAPKKQNTPTHQVVRSDDPLYTD
jgi:hypothetical protein